MPKVSGWWIVVAVFFMVISLQYGVRYVLLKDECDIHYMNYKPRFHLI